VSTPTEKDVEDLLKRLGVDPGGWRGTSEKPTQLPFVKAQIRTLERLRDYLNGVVESDTQKIAQLREQITRMQRGGGS